MGDVSKPPSSPKPSDRVPFLLWLVGGVSAALTAFYSWNFVFDDAYISFRYARNLTEHGELAWNLGERVEGYTNFLYVLATSALTKLGISPITAVRSMNLAAAAAIVVLYDRTAKESDGDSPTPRAIGGLFLVSSVCFPLWLLGGLESLVVAVLELGAIRVLAPMFVEAKTKKTELSNKQLIGAGVLFGLAALTRLDAVVIAGAVLFGGLLFIPMDWKKRTSKLVLVGATMSIIVALHIAWRWSYYESLLPNTFHAKVGVPMTGRITAGFEYLLDSLWQVPAIPAACGIFVATQLQRSAPPFLRMLALTIGVHLAYIVWAGGDHLPAARFFVPLVAPAALLIAIGLSRRLGQATQRIMMGVGLLAAAITPFALSIPAHGGAEAGEIIGNYISEEWPDDSLVALNVAGATPYFAPNHRFVDMLGLNDSVIARRDPVPMRTEWQNKPGHAKGDGAYVLSREPDYIILGGGFGADAADGWFLGDVELAESPEFSRCYRRETETLTDPERYTSGPLFWSEVEFIYYRRTCR